MKKWFLILTAVVACAGCSAFEEAYFLDREFGRAQMESWDKMIAYPENPASDKQPEGIDGINAEPAMDVYHRSFSKEPTASNVIKLGIAGD